jgi:hypothetical protein
MGNGLALYCPSFPVTSALNPITYSTPQFMSTDGGGEVRGTMLYNPRVQDATNGIMNRAFSKTSSYWTEPGSGGSKLFGVDYIGAGASQFTPNEFAHYPSQGFDCVFKDGSVQFVQSVLAFQFISGGTLISDESTTSHEQFDQLFNWLENGN